MYPSGVWRGFWEQPAFGRQAMADFRLKFHDGTVTGSGVDVIGEFVFRGVFDLKTGEIRMVKQYLDEHAVLYVGRPDGEGSIAGTWSIDGKLLGIELDEKVLEMNPEYEEMLTRVYSSGPFVIQPVLGRATGEEPIIEITK